MISRKFQMKQKTLKEEVDTLKNKFKTKGRMLRDEIPLPEKPVQKTLLKFPSDVTEIPNEDLGMYLGVYEAHAAWVSFCIAQKEIDCDIAKALLSFVYNKILTSAEGKITEQRAVVEGNSFYVSCKMELLDIEADLKLMEASLDSLNRYSKTISREISNRSFSRDSYPAGRVTTGKEIFYDHNKS